MLTRDSDEADRNPFADAPAPAPRPSHRPTPSLVIAAAMAIASGITSAAETWDAVRNLSGLMLIVVFGLLVMWAKTE